MLGDEDIISVDVAESEFGVQLGPTVLVTHGTYKCLGEICCIHNPTDHGMVTWKQNWRDDKGIMERVCKHGVGHPDPDDLKVRNTTWAGIHGCDGCCRKEKS